MKELLEMKQKRARLVNEARALLDKAKTEKRGMATDEEQQYDRIMSDVTALGKTIEAEERVAGLETDLEKRGGATFKQDPQAEEKRNVHTRATDEYRTAFWDAIRRGSDILNGDQRSLLTSKEVRSLSTGINEKGGYTVPEYYEKKLITALADVNVMRGLATIITTSGDTKIPVEADKGTASWLEEEGEYQESDATFGQKMLGAYKLGRILKVSEELLYDSMFNLEDYIADAYARSFGEAEENAFVNGDGNGKPTGLFGGAELGHTASTIDALTADDIFDLFFSLKRPYRAKATFLVNDTTVKALSKLKNSNGDYIWSPSLQTAQPDRLLGRPVAVTEAAPELGAGAKPIAFGDMKYYYIADRQGRVMQQLNEKFAERGQVGFRMRQRTDGQLILPEAVKTLKMAE
ncbi:capsid protein [Alkalihalophilus pseudofirmus]|nr:capsid protein [Alkalihalophilus pseudofirmus]